MLWSSCHDAMHDVGEEIAKRMHRVSSSHFMYLVSSSPVSTMTYLHTMTMMRKTTDNVQCWMWRGNIIHGLSIVNRRFDRCMNEWQTLQLMRASLASDLGCYLSAKTWVVRYANATVGRNLYLNFLSEPNEIQKYHIKYIQLKLVRTSVLSHSQPDTLIL